MEAYEILEESRTSMEEMVAKMLFIKKEGKPKSELRELITQMSLLFVHLRQVNRTILLEEDRIKAETEKAKAPVDFTTLQLHNLMYEKNHYMKAIKACRDFKSKYPDIELVPEEEFFGSAPEEIKGNTLSTDSSHDLMLKRLHFELYQRKELCKLHEKLEQRKKSLQETIANRRKFLSSLPSHLKSLKKASLPVQQQLGIPHTKKLKQHHSAELLPPPLYVVYSQFLAQKEAFGEKIDLEILGSMKDAQAFAYQQAHKDTDVGTNGENRLEDDGPDEDDDGQRRRKRPKKVPGKESLDQAGVYQSHPLRIVLHVYDDEASSAKPVKLITLRFEYLVKLNVVCVGIEGSHEGPESNILCNLFPDDTGIDLPHETAKLFAGGVVTFDERKPSRPYKWAQHLAGIDFLPEASPLLTGCATQSNETAKGAAILSGLSLYRQQNRVQTVVRRVRSRKKAQLALVEQLDSLSKCKWPPLIYKNVPWALHTPSCTLQSWLPVGPTPNEASSSSVIAVEQVPNTLEPNIDVRSGALRENVESMQEDGELPLVVQPPTIINYSQSPPKGSDLEHSRHLALISKSMVPSKKGKSSSFKRIEDNSELILDSDSDQDEPAYTDQETENASIMRYNDKASKLWEDHAVRQFRLVLNRRMDRSGKIMNLESKIKISMEYPLRPPLFNLSLFITQDENSSGARGSGSASCEIDGIEWYNELRAMEAEVNLHILKMLPWDYENNTLAHQVYCLAMLFDYQINQVSMSSEARKSTSVIDIGLCKPVNGTILARSFRGRDRRKMISWKEVECTPGYPS